MAPAGLRQYAGPGAGSAGSEKLTPLYTVLVQQIVSPGPVAMTMTCNLHKSFTPARPHLAREYNDGFPGSVSRTQPRRMTTGSRARFQHPGHSPDRGPSPRLAQRPPPTAHQIGKGFSVDGPPAQRSAALKPQRAHWTSASQPILSTACVAPPTTHLTAVSLSDTCSFPRSPHSHPTHTHTWPPSSSPYEGRSCMPEYVVRAPFLPIYSQNKEAIS